MADRKPQNFFCSYPFWIGISIILGVSNATIADIINNGNSVTKDIALASTVAAGIASASKKLEDEDHLYTNNWCPIGRNEDEAQEAISITQQNKTVEVFSPEPAPEVVIAPSTTPAVPSVDNTAQTISTVLSDAQTVAGIVENPLNLLKLL